MSKIKNIVIIGMILGVSLLITMLLGPIVFVNNTSTIRPQLGTYIASQIQALRGNNNTSLVAESPEESLKKLEAAPFIMMTKGVYAKSNSGASIKEYRVNEIEWIEYTFDVKGKKVVLKVPKGETPPSARFAEMIAESQ